MNQEMLAQLASNYSIPPALLFGAAMKDGTAHDDVAALQATARQMRAQFDQHGEWPAALAAHRSQPWAAAVLGAAGSQPTYGLTPSFQPADPAAYHAAGSQLHQALTPLVDLGGVVTPTALAGLAAHIAPHAPAPPPTATPTLAPPPASVMADPAPGADPSEVAGFIRQARSLGINPDHFATHYPYAAQVSRQLSGQAPTLQEYAPMAAMDRAQMLEHIRMQPAPGYPQHTRGGLDTAWRIGAMHSIHNGRFPTMHEASMFAAAGADPKAIAEFYRQERVAQGLEEAKANG